MVFALTLPLIAIAIFAAPSLKGRNIASPEVIALGGYLILLYSLVQYIMMRIEVDERELIHEAVADRNALWTIIAVLWLGMIYELLSPAALHDLFPINPFIIGGLVLSSIVKCITRWRLECVD